MVSILRSYACLVAAVTFTIPGAAQQPVDRVVQAADKFLGTLSSEQRSKVIYEFQNGAQRTKWSNFPTGVVPRGGMSLKDMSGPQRTAALDLLKVVLSPMGYEKVSEIRAADEDFKANGSKRGGRGPGGPPPNGNGQPPSGLPPGGGSGGLQGGGPGRRTPFGGSDMFGGDLYYISFLGKPSTTFGHHWEIGRPLKAIICASIC